MIPEYNDEQEVYRDQHNEGLLRSMDPEKVATGLRKVVNIMEDLENMAEKHDVKQKLYHGDGIHKIYNT